MSAPGQFLGFGKWGGKAGMRERERRREEGLAAPGIRLLISGEQVNPISVKL